MVTRVVFRGLRETALFLVLGLNTVLGVNNSDDFKTTKSTRRQDTGRNGG